MLLTEMSTIQLQALKADCERAYEDFKMQNLKLDMSRGKPSPNQLDFSMRIFDTISTEDLTTTNGFDCRNYGLVDGTPEAKAFFGEMLGTDPDEVIVQGNSSLSIMFNLISNSVTHGVLGGLPWHKQESGVKFLCPVPGYDRHFAICEYFGIDMINIPMDENGPDMGMVESLVKNDESIKGIWCVPQYSNPSGIVYSNETIQRLASLKPKATDFRIYCDNAYCVHHLVENPKTLLNIMEECKKNQNENILYVIGSTSKITFAGAGVAALCASKDNIKSLMKPLSVSTLGYDKISQMRLVKFIQNAQDLKCHMDKHRKYLAPKFNTVYENLERDIKPLGIGKWDKPEGGYFITFYSINNCAKQIVKLCKGAGVVLTPAGATHPYGNDPNDNTIRIAPSFPTVDELNAAMELFCISVKLASIEKILDTRT